MPIVNMLNAVLTFFVMGVMTGFMTRLPGAGCWRGFSSFCALSVAGIRAIIPFGIDLIYPALFMLKSNTRSFWRFCSGTWPTTCSTPGSPSGSSR
jgi:hypothetical protein